MRWFKLALVGLIFLVSACTPTQQMLLLTGADLGVATHLADAQIKSGKVAATILSISLTDSGNTRVSQAFADYGEARKALEGLIDSPLAMLTAVNVIQAEHSRLYRAYLELQDVVVAHWPEYGLEAQESLLTWQKTAYQLEASYGAFLDACRMQEEGVARQRAAMNLFRVAMTIATTVA